MNTENPKNQKQTHKKRGRENQKFIIVYIYTEKKKAERRKKGIPQKEKCRKLSHTLALRRIAKKGWRRKGSEQ